MISVRSHFDEKLYIYIYIFCLYAFLCNLYKKRTWTQGNWWTLFYRVGISTMHHYATLWCKHSRAWLIYLHVCRPNKDYGYNPDGQSRELQLSGHAGAPPSLSMAMSESVGESSLWFFLSLLNVRDSELLTCGGHSVPCCLDYKGMEYFLYKMLNCRKAMGISYVRQEWWDLLLAFCLLAWDLLHRTDKILGGETAKRLEGFFFHPFLCPPLTLSISLIGLAEREPSPHRVFLFHVLTNPKLCSKALAAWEPGWVLPGFPLTTLISVPLKTKILKQKKNICKFP